MPSRRGDVACQREVPARRRRPAVASHVPSIPHFPVGPRRSLSSRPAWSAAGSPTRPRAATGASGTIGPTPAIHLETSMPASPTPSAPLAFYWGDDAYGQEAAADARRRDRALFPDGEPERWRLVLDPGNPRSGLAELGERLATGAMFGSGVLAVVSGVGAAARTNEHRDRLVATLGVLAPGNGLIVLEETETGTKEPPAKAVAEAIRGAGGEVRRFEAPKEGGLAAWIEARARERGIALAPGAARELATRVGGFVREGDVDRRQQGRLAVMELEKLALRHDEGATVTIDDVQALVAEAIPGTIWGFVDAVGMRQRERALELLER